MDPRQKEASQLASEALDDALAGRFVEAEPKIRAAVELASTTRLIACQCFVDSSRPCWWSWTAMRRLCTRTSFRCVTPWMGTYLIPRAPYPFAGTSWVNTCCAWAERATLLNLFCHPCYQRTLTDRSDWWKLLLDGTLESFSRQGLQLSSRSNTHETLPRQMASVSFL